MGKARSFLILQKAEMGSNHQGAIVTYADKASKFLIAGRLKRKTIEEVNPITLEKFVDFEKEERFFKNKRI